VQEGGDPCGVVSGVGTVAGGVGVGVGGAGVGAAGAVVDEAVVVGAVSGGVVMVAVVVVGVGVGVVVGEGDAGASLVAEGVEVVTGGFSLSLFPSGLRRSLSGWAFLTDIRSPWLSGSLGS
jgi:hypothetical protein